jgi:hypothetical protein
MNHHSGILTQAFRFHEDSPHVLLLEPYHASTIPGRTHEPPPPIVVDGKQEYKVEEILNSRMSHHQL